jgi:hypothetical protein
MLMGISVEVGKGEGLSDLLDFGHGHGIPMNALKVYMALMEWVVFFWSSALTQKMMGLRRILWIENWWHLFLWVMRALQLRIYVANGWMSL